MDERDLASLAIAEALHSPTELLVRIGHILSTAEKSTLQETGALAPATVFMSRRERSSDASRHENG